MKLTDILCSDCIRVPLVATEKLGAITELVDLLYEQGKLRDRDVVLHAVVERERTRSTGIGHGLAVPHGKCAGCPKLVMALGCARPGIDFQSKDGQPATVIALLASPVDQTGPHIQALARISRLMLMDDFRTAMADAGSADELFEIISRHESR